MSNRSQLPLSQHHEEGHAFNIWKSVPKSVDSNDTMHGFNFNQTQSQGCNSNIWNTHPICNPISMQYNNIDKQNEEYKISSSLKTIWNNACESKPTTFNHPFDNSDSGADMKKMTKSPVATGFDKLDDEIALVANLLNGNALKGRAITARNGLQNSNYMSNFGIENGSINQNYSSSTPASILNPREPMEQFLQRLQLIVQNGFLSPQILNEPIAPETYELVQMLIHYVMEYGRTKVYAKSCTINQNPELNVHVQEIFYKIGLIQKEIATCQSKYLEHRREQQKILQSFSVNKFETVDGSIQQSQQMFNQFGVPMTLERNNRCSQTANKIDSAPRKPFENIEPQNQRFSQRQLNPYMQQENVNNSGNFMFLPKAKNIENRSTFYEHNHNHFSRRDGNSTTN